MAYEFKKTGAIDSVATFITLFSCLFPVPIIPDYLLNVEMQENARQNRLLNFTNPTKTEVTSASSSKVIHKGFKTPIQLEWELMESENGPIGMLLSSKAIIQLIINPFVGHLTGVWGYNLPMFIGTFNLLIAALREYFLNSWM